MQKCGSSWLRSLHLPLAVDIAPLVSSIARPWRWLLSRPQRPVENCGTNLDKEMSALFRPPHLTPFAIRMLTSSLTADSAVALLIGRPARYRAA